MSRGRSRGPPGAGAAKTPAQGHVARFQDAGLRLRNWRSPPFVTLVFEKVDRWDRGHFPLGGIGSVDSDVMEMVADREENRGEGFRVLRPDLAWVWWIVSRSTSIRLRRKETIARTRA